MPKTIKLKESDLTNLVKRILAEKGVNENFACYPPGIDTQCRSCNGSSGEWETNCEGTCGANPDCPHGGKIGTMDGDKHKSYEKIDHDRGKFDGRPSKVIGVDSDIKKQRFEKNIKEGYKKFGCKFLQSSKSLNEDNLTHLLNTDRDIREQKNLTNKLKFIESAIGLTKCGTILREQKEGTTISRNDYRRARKLVYENMDWAAVRRNNNKRLLRK
tara:strand:+ start:156 stop:800 length:645 start_codon:yes stop_codon:yes gene_type:complete